MRRLGVRLAGALGRALAGLRAVLGVLPGRRFAVRAITLVAALFTFLGTPSMLYYLYVQSVEMQFYQLHMGSVDFNLSEGCTLPHYEPFDQHSRPFIFPWPPVACGNPQPYLTYVDQEGFIRVNWTGARDAGLSPEDFQCVYSEIQRKEGSDDEVEYGLEHVLRDFEKLYAPYVRVRCVTHTRRLLYETCHAVVTDMDPELSSKVKDSEVLRPSIFILGIDSMSRLNTMRQLPKTHSFLVHNFSATVFTGLTKVGDNTYPNMLTMLTGMAARKKPGIGGSVWGDDKANGFFDDLPLVWKNFSDNGYVTMYSEDLPEYTAFNYLAKGFKQAPTHYYMRPFWLCMDKMQNFPADDDRCYGNTPQYEILFNYTREFLHKMASKRYFAFTFITSYSHNHINSVQVLDDPVRDFLAELVSSGVLRNTIVIVLGDHGNRFDAIRVTVVGRVEERMPYLAVALPPDLYKALPHLERNLRANRDTLISWYDVYELLADVAFDNLGTRPRVQRWGQLGTSLFRPVPSRSCAEAGVPREYCVCGRERQLSTMDPLARAMALDLVRHVNELLAAYGDSCVPLTLSDVINAQLILPNELVARPQGFAARFRVALRVQPSQALLEGLLEVDAWSHEGRVVGEVARINKYGNQSHCVRDKIVRLYCYCVDMFVPPAG